jgi:hypothetical protein
MVRQAAVTPSRTSPRRRIDPFVFEDGADLYLFYAGAGESAIGIAALDGL